MQNFLEVWSIPLAVVLVMLFVFLLVRWAGKKRREALSRFAQMQGLSYVKEETELQNAHCAPFHLFQQGHTRVFDNVIQGSIDGSNLKLFDYSYTTGHGKNRSTQTQTVAVFQVKNTELPPFELRPEHFFHKIRSLFGHEDINFPEDSRFSEDYFLKGKDTEVVQELFGPDIRNYFANDKTWSIEGGGQWLVIYKASRKTKIANLAQFMRQVSDIYRLFEKP